jgi:pyruvate dehydrogenase E1 component alpha subunit
MQLSRDELIRAYRTMRTIRAFEDRCAQEIGTGDIPGSVHLYAGEEASGVGICMHLSDKDAIASTHRGHGHCIAKGCDVEAMMAEIFGRATGTCKGKGGSMHIADLSKGMLGANGIVGGGPPLICGAALTAKTLKTGGVAVCFMGDGAFNQGTTAEAMNLAKVWTLPAIFVVENNGFGEATRTEFATAGDITARAAAYGMPAIEVDGLDFFAVHQAAGEVIERARKGGGPAMLHVKVPRFYGHFSGDAETYRSPEEKERIRREEDCLKLFRKRVTEAGLLDASQLDAIDKEAAALIDKAVKAARAAPLPDPREVTTDVYVRYA